MGEQDAGTATRQRDTLLSSNLIDATLDLWKQIGRKQRIPIRGRSMWPLFREGDDVLVAIEENDLRRGDVIVFWRGNGLVAHRVLQIVRDGPAVHYVTGGDNSTRLDPPVEPAHVLGRVVGLQRNGRSVSIDTATWRWLGRGIALGSLILKRLATLYRDRRTLLAGSQVDDASLADRMRLEDRLLLACTRQNVTPAHREQIYRLCRNDAPSWEYVYETAVKHDVAPLVYTNLMALEPMGHSVPADILQQFRLFTYRAALLESRQTRTLAQILHTLDDLDIDVLLIKGVALDECVYEEGWYTSSQDVDLVLRPRHTDACDDREIDHLFSGLPIEWEWFEHHDVTLNGVLPIDFDRIWNAARQIEIAGRPAFVMSPEHMLIAACLNSCRKRFFRLKALCDLAELIARYPDLDWKEVVQTAHDFECNTIVYTALTVTKTTLGCDVPASVLERLIDSSLRALLVRQLITYLVTRPLASLYVFPDSGEDVRRRRFSLSVLLPYASYRRRQAEQKLKEAYSAWRAQ